MFLKLGFVRRLAQYPNQAIISIESLNNNSATYYKKRYVSTGGKTPCILKPDTTSRRVVSFTLRWNYLLANSPIVNFRQDTRNVLVEVVKIE